MRKCAIVRHLAASENRKDFSTLTGFLQPHYFRISASEANLQMGL